MQHLLEMAFWHNQTGNVSAAITACEAALLIDSDSTTALSLLGCLYERQGDPQKAVGVFERVVEINPDSEADQEKLAALKRGEYLRPVLQPLKYRWLPPALVMMSRDSKLVRASIAAAVALIFFGAGLALLKPHVAASSGYDGDSASSDGIADRNPGQTDQASTQGVSAAPQTVAAEPARSSTGIGYAVIPATTTPLYPAAATQAAAPSNGPLAARDSREDAMTEPIPVPQSRRDGGSPIPSLAVAADANSAAPSVASVRPLEPMSQDLDNAVRVAVNSLPQHMVAIGPSGAQAMSGDGSGSQAQSNEPPPPASHIYVHVHDASDDAGSSSNVVNVSSSGGGGEQTRGAELQQRALSLQNQGSFAQAVRAYSAAIAAYRGDIAAGRGVDEANAAIRTCETGLEICQASQ
jgi:tetratricopeptide (TPR) repeat protein